MNLSNYGNVEYQIIYPKIIETIRLLASSPEVQLSIFPEDVFPPDEIVEIFEHSFLMLKQIKHCITEKQFACIKIIDDNFGFFKHEDWTISAVRDSYCWENCRNLAQLALKEFNVAYTVPNLYWISF